MHYAYHIVGGCIFFYSYVSVSFEDDDVALSAYDTVDQDVAPGVTYEGYRSSFDVAVCPGA